MWFKKISISVISFFATVAIAAGGNLSAGQEMPFPVYGSGAVEVRMYSDYFCPPCQKMEPVVEPILKKLVKENNIRLTLVDVPFHPASSLYTRYFLYALKSRNNTDEGFHVRNVLFQAASGKGLTTGEKLEGLFKSRKIPYDVFDPQPALNRFNALIKEDNVHSTPTCVIIKNGKKEVFVGGPDIIKALTELK